MVQIGSKTSRKLVDYKLSRYGCYLIVQNGDSRKKAIWIYVKFLDTIFCPNSYFVFKFIPIPLFVMGPQPSFIT